MLAARYRGDAQVPIAPDAGSLFRASPPHLEPPRYLVKRSDHLPYMALNEHHTLRVLARPGKVPVTRTQMSDDGRILLVERFDVDAQEVPTHGLEDACSLMGLPPHEKYAPSMERVLKATETCPPDASRQAQLEHLGHHLLTNFVVRNGDCHSKNLALYYTSFDDVTFTPVHDLATTQAEDIAALLHLPAGNLPEALLPDARGVV